MSADDSHLVFPEKESANYHLGEELHLEGPQRCLKDGSTHFLILSITCMLIAMLKNGIYDDIIDRRLLHTAQLSTWQQPPSRLAVGKEILNDLLLLNSILQY